MLKSELNDKDFLSKLRYLSAQRDITPWLKSLKFSDGLIGKVLKGQEPGADLLRALARTERVSLRWLEDGRGAPYLVSRMTNDEEAIEYLDELLAEDWDRLILATADDERFAVILDQPGEYRLKEKWIKYHIVEVVAGNISLETLRWLAKRHKGLWMLRLTPDDMDRLSRGYMGNIELFGYEDPRKRSKGFTEKFEPLIDKIESTLHDSPYQALHEPPEGQEPSKEPLTTEEAILVEKYRQLGPDDQRHAQAVVGAFAHKDGGKRKVK
jgi:hypothetical protein